MPYNGSVARVSFGPVVAARVRRWLREGDFDVMHLHEPATPSLSLLALWAAECPVVATFHTSNVRSRAMSASASILRPSLEKITARIAVSEYARDTLVQHIGGEPVVIPNGVYVDQFADAAGPGRTGRAPAARCASWAASTSRARACPCSSTPSPDGAEACRGAAARRRRR